MRLFLVGLFFVIVAVGVILYSYSNQEDASDSNQKGLSDTSQEDASEYLVRGIEWVQQGELDKAIAEYTEAIRIDPLDANAFLSRGIVWGKKGEYDKAIADFTEAIRINPKAAEAFYNRGNAWQLKTEYDKAIADYTEEIRINPQHVFAFRNRGYAWYLKAEYEKAIADYTKGIRINPQDESSLIYRAKIRATCPEPRFRNGTEAVKDATKACELTQWKLSGFLAILGAAYAEANDFPEAIKWIKKAMSLDDLHKETRAQMLALFEAGQPYREEPQK